MHRYNNWMRYSFRDGGHFKSHPTDPMILYLQPKSHDRNMSYRDALYYNARMVADNFTGPFDVFLSGGIDSEVIVRVNHDLGIKQNLYTVRLENGLNVRDVTSAQHIADQLGVKLNIIDFNAERWLEQHGEHYYKKTYTTHCAYLLRLCWYDYVDNTPVMGNGEPYWIRQHKQNYDINSPWFLYVQEHDFSIEFYDRMIDRVAVSNWYQYTPEITMNFHKLPLIQQLLQDKISEKQSSWSSRISVHRRIWPQIIDKPKLVGYEGEKSPGTWPDFISVFTNSVMKDAHCSTFYYTERQLESM